jgi:phenylacetate-coenzyme A ligase PaaK-like adenylate-forming protein
LAHQQSLLQATLQHAVMHSPYYRETLAGDRARGDSLTDLPTINKKVLVENFDRMVTDPRLSVGAIETHLASADASDPLFGEYRICATGGTTGVRALMVYDKVAWAQATANSVRFMAAIGATPATRTALIGSPTPLHLSHRLFAAMRATRPSIPELHVTTPLPELVATLNAYAPEILITYASLLRELAEEQLYGRLRIAPRVVGSNAEILTDDVRELGRRAWGVTVLNRYATTELGMTGVECLEACGIHLPEDLVLFEVVDERNRPVTAGARGAKLLVTTLVNRALPLIRYELSDRVVLDPSLCRCGRPYARMVGIDGRAEELLWLPRRRGGDAEVHALRLQPALIGLPGVRQFQIVQLAEGLEVRLAVRDGTDRAAAVTAAERGLAALLATHDVGPERFRVMIVEQIERAGTGAKLRMVEQAK